MLMAFLIWMIIRQLGGNCSNVSDSGELSSYFIVIKVCIQDLGATGEEQ